MDYGGITRLKYIIPKINIAPDQGQSVAAW